VVEKELYDLYIMLAVVMLAYVNLSPCGLVNMFMLVPAAATWFILVWSVCVLQNETSTHT
jgi:hypothetical protein